MCDVHSEGDRKEVEMACLNIYRLRKTTVTSILTGAVLASVDWLTSERFQLLNFPTWYIVLFCMRLKCGGTGVHIMCLSRALLSHILNLQGCTVPAVMLRDTVQWT
jgi:hypothetical protein